MNSTLINTEKAYLLGLLVGGGELGPGGFTITLPLKSWGEVNNFPARAGQIANDVLSVINPMFGSVYGIGVSFAPGRDWVLSGHSFPSDLKQDLISAGLPFFGNLRANADVDRIVEFGTVPYKRAFVKGLADTIGSLAPSHRRFSAEYQVVSLEFSGFNFRLVAGVSQILTGIGCKIDQILWNHPNQHSGEDRYYSSWKKGMKIRVMLGDFGEQAGFGFTSKIHGARENQSKQVNPLVTRNVDRVVTSPKCLHVDEGSKLLPESIRGKHFLHWQHVGAAFGSSTVSKSQIESMFASAPELVSPFTLLTKDLTVGLNASIAKDPLLEGVKFEVDSKLDPFDILNAALSGEKFFTVGLDARFDLTRLTEAILYPILAARGETSGRRYKGNLLDQAKIALLSRQRDLKELVFRRDSRVISPIFISRDEFSSLVGPISPRLNSLIFNFDNQSLTVTHRPESNHHVIW